ncbi:MAG: flagellar biosynthetic protein FliO [Ignavibacteriaceae bacterium]|nr:flagellar biosynthetic protein FliO [Ignavibacteriaceae bacterium]
MSFIELIKLIFPLLIISGLLLGLLYFAKRFALPKGKSNILNIKVLSSQMLMPKKYISIVKVQDKLLVLGVSEGGINLLKEIPATDVNLPEEMSSVSPLKFSDVFKKFSK